MSTAFASLYTVDVKLYVIIAVSCVIIFFLMVDLLKDKRPHDTLYPSTFFSLDQITSHRWFQAISFFFAGSIAILYASVALYGGTLLRGASGLLLSVASPLVATDAQAQLTKFFETIPPWLEPLFILIVFLLLFYTKFRTVMTIYRDIILNAAGFYSIVDETSLECAHDYIDKNGHDASMALATLSDKYSEFPLPEEFVGSKGPSRLAYQLIWLLKRDIKENGVSSSFNSFRTAHNLEDIDISTPPVVIAPLFAAGMIFAILMTIFLIVDPTLRAKMEGLGFQWIQETPNGWSSLIRTILANTLGFVFPLVLACNMYSLRRRAYGKPDAKIGRPAEDSITTFSVVAVAGWILSFLVYEMFNLIDVSIAFASKQEYYFSNTRIHVAAFCYAFAPVVAFAILRYFQERHVRAIIVVPAASIGVAIAFCISEVLYECCWQNFDYYFVHQGFFGFFVSLSFLVSILATGQTAILGSIDTVRVVAGE